MPVIVLDRSVRSDDYPWEEAVWWVPSADAFVSFCCYIKGKAKKSMERIEGTVLCQIWFVTSDCRSRVIHQTQRHTKSFLFRRPSFSPSLGCPSSSIKKPKRCGCLCVHTALVYTYRTCTIYSYSLSLWCFRLPSYRPNVIRSIVLAGGRSIMARGSQKRQGPYSPAACTTREWGVLDRWRYFHMGVHTATTATTETRKFFCLPFHSRSLPGMLRLLLLLQFFPCWRGLSPLSRVGIGFTFAAARGKVSAG